MSSLLLVCSVLFLSQIGICFGLRCYQCNSFSDSNCTERKTLTKDHLQECKGTVTLLNFIPCDSNNPNEKCQELIRLFNESFNNCTKQLLSADTTTELNTTTTNTKCKEMLGQGRLGYDERIEKEVNFTICRKIVTSIYETYTTKQADKEFKTTLLRPRISRQCGYEPDERHDNTCVPKRTMPTSQLTCSCSEDECNASTDLRLSFLIRILILITPFVIID